MPDGTIITFKTNDGSIIPISSTIVNGQANATYIADGTGAPKQVTVFGNVDNTLDHVATYINIQQIPTKTFLNPVSNFAGQSVTLVAKITDNKDKLIDGGNVTFNIGIAPYSNSTCCKWLCRVLLDHTTRYITMYPIL